MELRERFDERLDLLKRSAWSRREDLVFAASKQIANGRAFIMARSEGSDVKGVAATSENSSKELSKFVLKLFLIFVVCLLAGYGIVTKFGTKPSAGRDVETFDGKREAGDRAKFEIDGVEFVFRYCPAGSFMMGADDEGRHTVELTRGFWLQETEVTEEQWKAVTGERTKRKSRRRSSWYDDDDDYDDSSSNSTSNQMPARGHSWAECQKFVLKMNEKPELPNGWRVSLPTEAQWEYACRAKPQGIWGRLFGGKNAPPKPKEENEPENIFDARDKEMRETRRALAKVDKYAWCAENTGGGRSFFGITEGGKPRSVGLKEPNRWGFYDMLGNVSEWCLDYYGEYPFGKVVDPARLDSGDDLLWDADGKRVWLYGDDASRVARGGSCMNSASACNPTKRLSYSTLLWDEDAPVGARLALVSSDAPELLTQQDYEAIVAEADAEDEEERERIVNLSKAREAREFRPSAAFSVESFDATPGKPGERRVLKIGNVEFAFRYCPPGEFSMGSDVGEGYSWERPRRDVKIGAGYWLQETETTQEQWLAAALDNPSAAQGKELPVERVTWSDCQRFVERLNGAPGGLPEGWVFSLPAEAQWEYACRAGTTEERYGKLDDVAWYRYNGDQTAKRGGQKKPNAWGLCDMLGGVEEWVLDEFAAYPDPDGTAKESDEKNLRVRRGGSVASDPEYCRAAFRYPRPEDDRNKFAGFRLAIVATKELEAFNAEYSFALTPFELADGEPGERRVLKVGEVEVPFRYCPSGEFTMGSPEDEEGRSSNETQHNVVLTQGFWIMETEATHKLWKAITGKKAKDYKGDFLPVVRSWNDWKKIVDQLNVALGETSGGWRFALPTEAQWEYACRAGTTGARYGEIDEIAGSDRRSFRWEPRAVGALKPNAWGLYDVLGNVPEWCADWSSDYKDYPKGDAIDPVGPAKGSEHVIRGGDRYGNELRAAERNEGNPNYPEAGARLVLARPIQSALGRKIVPFDPNGTEAGERRVLKIGDVEFAFRYCPPGEFLMGSPESEGEENERPQRNVSLTNGYWIMETEITEKQWATITRDDSDIEEKNEQKPKSKISWDDCQEFLKTLNDARVAVPEGWRYALPTEAQWEYACRAGSTESRYGELDEIAWHKGNRIVYELGAVGQKKPNAWGLYDSLGNAMELCEDWYDFYPEGDATDPVGPSEGSYRVARGGTSTSETADCRAARRFRVKPDERYGYDMGARFVLVRDTKGDQSVSSETKASPDGAGKADDL